MAAPYKATAASASGPDGRWEGRYTLGADPGTGKQRRKSVYASTQAECRKKLREATEAVANGTYSEPSRITVAAWLDIWLAEYLGSVKPGTVANYSQHVKNHLKPALGALKLRDLHAPDIQRVYNVLEKQGISPKTIKNLHGCFHKALETARKIGYIPLNPAEACVLPRVVEKEIQPLDKPEMAKLLEALRGHEYEALFKTALFTGMRSGELLGLTWDCIDFKNGVILVKKQLLPPRVKGQPYAFGTLKNDKPRTIMPAPFIMQMLKEHKHKQSVQRLRAGSVWDDGGFPGLVFTHDNGSHLTQSGVWKALQKILDAAGLEKHRFHDLRHTYAVSSLRAGDDVKTVQGNLGHHSAAFTLDKYGHVTETMKQESANRMEAFAKDL